MKPKRRPSPTTMVSDHRLINEAVGTILLEMHEKMWARRKLSAELYTLTTPLHRKPMLD
jgi:hypothetical protein